MVLPPPFLLPVSEKYDRISEKYGLDEHTHPKGSKIRHAQYDSDVNTMKIFSRHAVRASDLTRKRFLGYEPDEHINPFTLAQFSRYQTNFTSDTNTNSLSQDFAPLKDESSSKTISRNQTHFTSNNNTNSLSQNFTSSGFTSPAGELSKYQTIQTPNTKTNSLSQDSIPPDYKSSKELPRFILSQDYIHTVDHKPFTKLSPSQNIQTNTIANSVTPDNTPTDTARIQTIHTNTDAIILTPDYTHTDDRISFASRAQTIKTHTAFTHPDDQSFVASLTPGFKSFALEDVKSDDRKDDKMTHVQYSQVSSPTHANYIKHIRTITHEQYEFLKNTTKKHDLYDLKGTKNIHAQFDDKTQRNAKTDTKMRGNDNGAKATPVKRGRPLNKKKMTCVCSFCSKSFATTRALQLHVRRHSGLRPYPCKFCDKSFYQPSERAVHMRTHTGARPYRCPHCLKLFRYSGDLKQHINIHTGNYNK